MNTARRVVYELTEAFRIASAQLRAHKLRSVLTATGVIIGIVAVSLMGTAIRGMDVTFESSLAMLGDDILYVQKWPWHSVEDWWNYVNRPPISPEDAKALNRIIGATPGSLLEVAIPTIAHALTVKNGKNQVDGVYTAGTTGDFSRILRADFKEGRLFTDEEADAGRSVCVLGEDVAQALFPGASAVGRRVTIQGHPFRVIGVLAHQGSFLGLFSFDNQAVVPLGAYLRYLGGRYESAQLSVKVRDKRRMADATDELIGDMRRVRGELPGERDNFSVNQQEAFKAQLDPIRTGIARAGLFVTGLALFVGAIGIMNITFVSVKERTKEIGTRKALGARRRTILLQFLIESASVALIGGVIGILLTWALALAIGAALPKLPVEFSPGLMALALLVSAGTGLAAGFVPAWGASRLDPVVALRYE
ncbi:MAG: ABC transporter permease [Opitutaceae bacterium]